MDFNEWELNVPARLRNDPIWRTKAYRLSVFLTELLHADCQNVQQHVTARASLPQLYEAVGSIGANIAEGYSRSSGRDRSRFFQYALGSARESRHWYYTLRSFLSAAVVHERLELLDEIIRLLVTMVIRQRVGT